MMPIKEFSRKKRYVNSFNDNGFLNVIMPLTPRHFSDVTKLDLYSARVRCENCTCGFVQAQGGYALCNSAREQLAARQEGWDRWITAWALVALLESGVDPADEQVLSAARWLSGPDEHAWVNDDPLTKGPDNLGNWAIAATCVALAEHDLARGTQEWRPTLERCAAALAARCSEEGRYGHDVVTGYGGKGLNVINCLAHLAWERCEATGASIDRAAWDRSLESLRASLDTNGGVRYWTMKGTGTGDATLRTASLALALGRAEEAAELNRSLLDYLERHPARAREAHAMGTPGLMLTPHALATRSPEAREAFLEEWRWYLALMRGPDDRLHYIGGKGNNGGDSYLGFGQVAAVTALLLVAEPGPR